MEVLGFSLGFKVFFLRFGAPRPESLNSAIGQKDYKQVRITRSTQNLTTDLNPMPVLLLGLTSFNIGFWGPLYPIIILRTPPKKNSIGNFFVPKP